MQVTGRYTPPQRQIVIHGAPLEQSLPPALAELWARQSVLVTTRALTGAEGQGARIRALLGEGCTDYLDDIATGAPARDVLRITQALRHKGTEVLVALGGGSVAEAAKAARICLTNNVVDTADMVRIGTSTTTASPRPYLICVPTTLAGAEYTPVAGIGHDNPARRLVVRHADLAPDIVLLDPSVTLDTPASLWASSGMRAVDHAIETWCASAGKAPLAEAAALQGLRLLTRGLRAWLADPQSLAARHDCQVGSWLAAQGAAMGVPHGPSHALGRPLTSGAGVAQGVTSAILLPHVLRFTGAAVGHLHAPLADAMGRADMPLSEAVAELVAALGLPSRLRDAGVGASLLDAAAASAMTMAELQTGGRPFRDVAEARGLLGAAF